MGDGETGPPKQHLEGCDFKVDVGRQWGAGLQQGAVLGVQELQGEGVVPPGLQVEHFIQQQDLWGDMMVANNCTS